MSLAQAVQAAKDATGGAVWCAIGAAMQAYLRLRQICLATDDLPRAAADIIAIFGVGLAHEDPDLAAYGVRNAVFPFGLSFIELVAPVREDTAAARFVRRGARRGAYMAIFNCDDARLRRHRMLALGMRIVAEIDREDFYAVQLHPRDCRATMIEFDRTTGEEDLRGPYFAAGGPGWTRALRTEVTQGIAEVVVESPTPLALCAHWARILDRPALERDGHGTIDVDLCRLRFVTGPAEALTTVAVQVADVDNVLTRAAGRGYAVADRQVLDLGGIRFRLDPVDSVALEP